MKNIFYWVCLVLVGCDVPGEIQIINRSGGTAFFRYTENEPQGDLKVNDIELKENNNKTVLLFGFGQFWNRRRIPEYAQSLKRIDIITATDTLTLSGQEEITQFLKDRRRGVFNRTIKVVIK